MHQHSSKCQNYARFEQYPSVTREAIRKSGSGMLISRIHVWLSSSINVYGCWNQRCLKVLIHLLKKHSDRVQLMIVLFYYVMKQNFYFVFPEIKKTLKENPKDHQLEQIS
jgi:hypothetical protein